LLSHLFGREVLSNTISNEDASSFIGAHIDPFFSPIGVFVECLNRAPRHDAHPTDLQ
jgi:hypothetical protein